MGSGWDREGIGMGSVWARYGIGMGSVWDRDGIGMGSVWDRDGIGPGWDQLVVGCLFVRVQVEVEPSGSMR